MIVDTTAGKVEGFRATNHDGLATLQFRGVTYARAERFGPPQSLKPWAGTRDATSYGPVAPQNVSPVDLMLGLAHGSEDEDCLVLNVCTPAADNAGRPVLVWIHGGGFTGGSGHVPHYDGTALAVAGDVVVVTLNYRLGALGFLHLDEVLPERAGSALNGVRDQIAALRWVRDNIAAFGGDPGRVTLFGESAGSMSVVGLMGIPEASGLFHAAIAQSGSAERFLSPAQAQAVTERLLDHLELSPSDVHRLLTVEPEVLVEAQSAVETGLAARPAAPGRPGPGYLQLPFQPVVDGDLIPGPPVEAVAGGAAPVPLVTGTTRDEWRLFMLDDLDKELAEDQLQRRAARLVGDDHATEAVAVYREARPASGRTDLWCAMVTDFVFRMPAVRLAEAQLRHTTDVYMYRFDHPSAAFGGLPGACHAIDVPFVFGNVDLPGIDVLLGGVDDGTRRLSQRCARSWAGMAVAARPGHDTLPWPAYDEERRATCVLDREVATVSDPEGGIRAFWQAHG